MSIKETNSRNWYDRGRWFEALNAEGIASTDASRLTLVTTVFPSAKAHPLAWLDDDDIVIRLLADLIRRVATDHQQPGRGGKRREPTREDVERVYRQLVARYRATTRATPADPRDSRGRPGHAPAL